MPSLGRARSTFLLTIIAAVLCSGLSGCGKDGPIFSGDRPRLGSSVVGMYSDGHDVFVVFPGCDQRQFASVLGGPPSFTVKDDKGQVLWKLTSIPYSDAATSQPNQPIDAYPAFTEANPVLKVGTAPYAYRTDVAWKPPAAGTMLTFEGADNVTSFSGSYRYGDTDPAGTIRVDGQSSTRDALEKKECAADATSVPTSRVGSSTPMTR